MYRGHKEGQHFVIVVALQETHQVRDTVLSGVALELVCINVEISNETIQHLKRTGLVLELTLELGAVLDDLLSKPYRNKHW